MSNTQIEKLLNQKKSKGVLYKAICNSEKLYTTTSNSISYVIIQIAKDAVKSEKIMTEIGTSIKKIISLYQNDNFISEGAKNPVEGLRVLWDYVSVITGHEFGELEEELLFRGSEFPIELINQISKRSNKFNEKSQIYGKTKLYEKLIEPIEKKINNLISIQNRK